MKNTSIFNRRTGLRPTSQPLIFTLLLWLMILIPLASASAQDFAWATRAGDNSSGDHGNSVAVDGAGNVYTTGFFAGSASSPADFGSIDLISASDFSNDAFVAKQDASGNYLWAIPMGAPNLPDEGHSIAVDASGNSYVTGSFQETVTFGSFTLTSALSTFSNSTDDIFVIKIDPSGTILWAKRFGGAGGDTGLSIAVDGAGSLFITGYFGASIDFGTTTLTGVGLEDIFVAKLDNSGNALWATEMGGDGFDRSSSIALDASGNPHVTGEFSNSASFGSATLTSAGGRDIFVSKLNASTGAITWVRQMGGTATDKGLSVAVDGSGDVYTTGHFEDDADFDPGAGELILSSTGSNESDVFISKFNSSGNFVWAKDIGSSGNDEGNAVAVDGSDNVYVTGYFRNTVDFDPGPGTQNLTSAGNQDIFIAKFTPAGLLTYAGRIGAGGRDIGNSIAVSSGGNMHITGQFGSTVDFDPGTGTTELTSGVPTGSSGTGMRQDIFVVKLDACANPTAYAVTGGGAYCAGGAGVSIGLADSETGVNYQLRLGDDDVGSPVSGTGSALDFGSQTAAGTYTVQATSASGGCTTAMTGSVMVTVNPLPSASIGGNGGAVCAGGDVMFTISGTDGATLTYTLTGQAGNQTLALNGNNQTITANGATANATLTLVSVEQNNCSASLSATSTVTVNPLPTATVSGGGTVCSGEDLPNVSIALTGAAPFTFTYTDGTSSATITGTSTNPFIIADTPAGTYSVTALSDDNGCAAASLSSSATVTVNDLPAAFGVTGSGSYCAGGAGVAVGLDGSEIGANYQLKRDGNDVGSPLPGTGNALNFGSQTVTGSYTVTATIAASSCTADMTGSATVTIDPLPSVNAGDDQSVILGFGGANSNCTDLTATASGGTGSYTYAWDNGAGSGPTVNVCPETTTTYEVAVTDGNGCMATDEVKVEVQDVRCGPQMNKAEICYYGVTQCVREKIAKRYLKMGATLGACGGSNPSARMGTEETAQLPLQLSLKAYPNPVQDAVTVEVLSPASGTGTFEVLDLTGRIKQSRQQVLLEGRNEVLFRLGGLPTGIYLIRGTNSLNQQGVVRVKKQ